MVTGCLDLALTRWVIWTSVPLFPPQAEYQLQESYFNVLVKKEQMEEKMRGIREMKCRAVTCKKVVTLTGIASGCPGGGVTSAVFLPPVQLHLLQAGRSLRGAESRVTVARRHQAFL